MEERNSKKLSEQKSCCTPGPETGILDEIYTTRNTFSRNRFLYEEGSAVQFEQSPFCKHIYGVSAHQGLNIF